MSKYNNGGSYIEDAQAAGNEKAREASQLSAEEIAAVLAESYFGGRVVGAADNKSGHDMDTYDVEEEAAAEEERAARRRQRVQEMRRRKKRQEQMRRLMLPCAVVFVVFVILAGLGIRSLVVRHRSQQDLRRGEGAIVVDTGNLESNAAGGEESSVAGVESETNLDASPQDESTSNQGGGMVFANSLNIAGCYFDSTIADTISAELARAEASIVRTLGGRSSEPRLEASEDRMTASPGSEVVSGNAVFIDVEAGRILGQRDATVRISPASMTKLLTVLVAAEHITDPDEVFEITQDIIDYSYINKCSTAGFEVGEKVTVRDLFYGTVLPSGGEAAVGLAVYAAGSQEAFVGLMNEKLDELGLSATTHFTNCVGIYDGNHYSTVYDIAVIMKAAYDNSFCREVLSAHTYKTSITEQHPEGIDLSNLFLRRIEDRDTYGEVLCAKTGFVDQSGNCAASLEIGNDEKIYICVTAHSTDSWQCMRDHVALYQQFVPKAISD